METISTPEQKDVSLHALARRRSTPVARLTQPAPTPDELDRIVGAALRVPDHGSLTPWRIIHVDDADRVRFAEALVTCHRSAEPDAAAAVLEKDRQRFGNSPLLLIVIGCIVKEHRIPEQEQLLSGACVCFGLLQAANALGYGAQWLTGWAAYDQSVSRLLNLHADERILGFIHMGTVSDATAERVRPEPCSVMTRWGD